jgi:hypothetical protein
VYHIKRTQPFISFLLLFVQGYQEFDEEYVITADAENVPHTLEDKHLLFSQCLLQRRRVCWSVPTTARSVLR